MGWLQSKIENLAIGLLTAVVISLAVGGATVLWAFLQSETAPVLVPIFFGTAGAVFWLTNQFDTYRLSHKRGLSRLDHDVVRQRLQEWFIARGYAVRAETWDGAHFTFWAFDNNGIGVIIARPKYREEIINVGTRVDIPKPVLEILQTLDTASIEEVLESMRITLLSLGMQYQMSPPDEAIPHSITVIEEAVCDDTLTEFTLLSHVSKVRRGSAICSEYIGQALRKAGHPGKFTYVPEQSVPYSPAQPSGTEPSE